MHGFVLLWEARADDISVPLSNHMFFWAEACCFGGGMPLLFLTPSEVTHLIVRGRADLGARANVISDPLRNNMSFFVLFGSDF